MIKKSLNPLWRGRDMSFFPAVEETRAGIFLTFFFSRTLGLSQDERRHSRASYYILGVIFQSSFYVFLELLKKFGILTSERGERAISVEGKGTKAVASSESGIS